MYTELKQQVCAANKELKKYGLAIFTWGNLSMASRKDGVAAIKPSGVEYDTLTFRDIVIMDFDGKMPEGSRKPSSDSQTHLEIYRNFSMINAIVHTHSACATAFAQAKCPIRCLGTTHADHFYGDIPVINEMTGEQILHDYELNTGRAIVNYYLRHHLAPMRIPACLLPGHGPFSSRIKQIFIRRNPELWQSEFCIYSSG
ncbi:MAG: class II aldolase/adducin family protein [Victivallales bacterium]|nr:class II aldolase/adducin family protein [Victivallales bacterium]